MQNLDEMYENMDLAGAQSNIFPVRYNGHGFSCILLKQDYGCTLFISTLGDAPETIAIDINPPFEAPTRLDQSEYRTLARYLGFTGATGNVFYPQNFFNEFDARINPMLTRPATLQEHARAVGSATTLVEKDGNLFCGWRNNGTTGTVTDKNFAKTRKIVGEEAALRLRAANISSRWTNNVDDENLARINEYLYFIDN